MELYTVSARVGRDAHPGTLAMLTRSDFHVAVKDALRHYTRADLLLANPLLETRIATGHRAKAAGVAQLQQVLVEAAETIFVNERDQRLLRVLELTYFQPGPKQEAVAERLGMKVATVFKAKSKVQRMLREEIGRVEGTGHEDV